MVRTSLLQTADTTCSHAITSAPLRQRKAGGGTAVESNRVNFMPLALKQNWLDIIEQCEKDKPIDDYLELVQVCAHDELTPPRIRGSLTHTCRW